MSFNRFGTIFRKYRGSAVFPAFKPIFHAYNISSTNRIYVSSQQSPKQLFYLNTIQNRPESQNDYDGMSTPHCSKRLQETLRSFRALNDAAPYDVTVWIEGNENTKAEIFKAHKLILGLFSQRFRQMWSSDVQHTANEPENIIRFSNVEPHAFAIMLRYMYADDTIYLTMESAMDLLFCARFFQADRLTQICRDFIEMNLAAGNACHVLQRARLIGEEKPALLALSVICKSPGDAFASPEFLQLFPSDLKAILDRDDLHMPEPLIYKHVRRWALKCVSQSDTVWKKSLRDAFGDLRCAIRFCLFDKDLLDNGPLKNGVITLQELDGPASPVNDPDLRMQCIPRQPAPVPFYISCQISCDAFGKDQPDWLTSRVVIELRPEFAPQTCAYARKMLKLRKTPHKWCNVRPVPSDGFSMDCKLFNMSLQPPQSVAQETNILSRTVPGAVCFGWEGEHCVVDEAPGLEQGRDKRVYSIWLAGEKPDGGAVFGRVVHGLELLESAYNHFLAGDVTDSYITYWTENWCLHESFPAKLKNRSTGTRIYDNLDEKEN